MVEVSQMDLFGKESKTMSSITPLRYVGGKGKAKKLIYNYVPDDADTIISPFTGGSAFEVYAAANGMKVFAYDIMEPLINFWIYFQNAPEMICNLATTLKNELDIKELLSASRAFIESGGNPDNRLMDDYVRAAYYWIISVGSFSGLGMRKSIGERFSEQIELLDENYFSQRQYYRWHNPNITFAVKDYRETLKEHKGELLYCDPPYVGKEDLYGTLRQESRFFDHEGFAQLLYDWEGKWILSYGDHEQVREMYKEYVILEPKWTYTAKPKEVKPSEELLILNF